MGAESPAIDIDELRSRMGSRPVVLVGLMGAGKTSVGRRLAAMMNVSFCDSDHEIEAASRMSVAELFAAYGETEFRALEQRVVARLLGDGCLVLATGGGAFVNAETRVQIARQAISVWLKADLDTLMQRVARRQDRPLLKTADPRATMEKLMKERYPLYGEADITVNSRDARHSVIAGEIIEALDRHLSLLDRRERIP